MVFFAQESFASIRVTQNETASSAQNKCVFDISLSEEFRPNYDTLTAYVNVKSKEAGLNEDVPLTSLHPHTTGIAEITFAAPNPPDGESKLYTFESTFYMARPDSGTDVKLNTSFANFTCKSMLFKAQEDIKQEIARQRVGGVISVGTTKVNTAAQRMGGGEFMVGNNTYTISGIGSALVGCSGASGWAREQLGSIFGSLPTTQESVSTNDKKGNSKEECGDKLAYAASRIVIENMSRSVVNWANSGNDGSSFFPKDYQSLYQSIKSKQVGDFVEELRRSSNGSSPFSSGGARNLAQFSRNQNRSFADRTRYTGPNASFYQDFRQGGWDSWFSYVLVPQNNPLGYSRLLSEENSNRQNLATSLIRDELNNNSGFLSQKVCADTDFKKWKDDAERIDFETRAKGGDKNAIKRVEQAKCESYKTVTPGGLIAEQVRQAIGSPMRQAEQADEINESLGSLFDAMVVNLASRGLAGLSEPGFRDRVNFSFNSKNNSIDQPTGGTFWDEFGTNFDLRRDLPNIINTQKAYINQLEKNNLALNTVLQGVERMDMVMPGPGLTWFEGQEFNGGYMAELTKIQNKYKNPDRENKEVQDFQEDIGLYKSLVEEVYKDRQNLSTYQDVYEGVSNRETYQNTLQLNQQEIKAVKDLLSQLEIIQRDVEALYKRACQRFIAENPGSICI